jgi:hypothetical protein
VTIVALPGFSTTQVRAEVTASATVAAVKTAAAPAVAAPEALR